MQLFSQLFQCCVSRKEKSKDDELDLTNSKIDNIRSEEKKGGFNFIM